MRARRTIVLSACLAASLAAGCQSPSLGRLHADGIAALYREDYPAARDAFAAYADRRPGDADIRYKLGSAYLGMGDVDLARESFSVAYDLDPETDKYLDALVDAMVRAGDNDDVFALLDRLTREDKGIERQLDLGRTAVRVGLLDEAERALVVAARIAEPTDVRPHRLLADLYKNIGDAERELAALRVILYLDPNDPAATARVRELGQVPGPTFARPATPTTYRP